MGHRGVTGWWAEWAIAHPDFGRIEGAARKRCVRRLQRIMYYLPTQIFKATYAPATRALRH